MEREIKITGIEFKKLIIESNNKSEDIVITIPSSIKWDDYEIELKTVSDFSSVINFKVSNFPTKTSIGNKCYLCYKGNIIGWMLIVGFKEKEFNCTTTGIKWAGKFIERSGPFNYLKQPIPMKGFQGYRYITNKIN